VHERRRSIRYPFVAGAEVVESLGAVHQAQVTDLSIYGCHLAVANSLSKGTSIIVKIRTSNRYFEAEAMVAHSSPTGMGIEFQRIAPPFVAVLQEWLGIKALL
jgi:hypothetical protein